MLSDRKRELEHRLSATLEENDLLQGTVEELQDRVLILERQGHDKDLQVPGQRSCSVGLEPDKRALSCLASATSRVRSGRSLPAGRVVVLNTLTELAGPALPRRNASLPTGHSSILF